MNYRRPSPRNGRPQYQCSLSLLLTRVAIFSVGFKTRPLSYSKHHSPKYQSTKGLSRHRSTTTKVLGGLLSKQAARACRGRFGCLWFRGGACASSARAPHAACPRRWRLASASVPPTNHAHQPTAGPHQPIILAHNMPCYEQLLPILQWDQLRKEPLWNRKATEPQKQSAKQKQT